MDVRTSNFRHCAGGANALRRLTYKCKEVEGGVLPPCVLGDRAEAMARVLRGEDERPVARLVPPPPAAAVEQAEVRGRHTRNRRQSQRQVEGVRQDVVVVRKEASGVGSGDVIDDGNGSGRVGGSVSDGVGGSVSERDFSGNEPNNAILGSDDDSGDDSEDGDFQPEDESDEEVGEEEVEAVAEPKSNSVKARPRLGGSRRKEQGERSRSYRPTIVVRRADAIEELDESLSSAEDEDDDQRIRDALDRAAKRPSGALRILPPLMSPARLQVEGTLRERKELPAWYTELKKSCKSVDFTALPDWMDYVTALSEGSTKRSVEIGLGSFRLVLFVCAGERRPLPKGVTCSQLLLSDPLPLLRFFQSMTGSDMVASTKANYVRAAIKAVAAAHSGFIRVPADLKRNAGDLLKSLKREAYRTDVNKNRETIERRNPVAQVQLGNQRFLDLDRMERIFALGRLKLEQVMRFKENRKMWKRLYISLFTFLLFEIPVRPSFFNACNLEDVVSLDDQGVRRYGIRPGYEKALHNQRTPRDYFFVPPGLTDAFRLYLTEIRPMLLDKKDNSPSSPLLVNEDGERLPEDRMSLWFRKYLWEFSRHFSKTDGGPILLMNLREYRHVFSVSVQHSGISEMAKDFIAGQMRHSKSTVQLYYNTAILPSELGMERVAYGPLNSFLSAGKVTDALKLAHHELTQAHRPPAAVPALPAVPPTATPAESASALPLRQPGRNESIATKLKQLAVSGRGKDLLAALEQLERDEVKFTDLMVSWKQLRELVTEGSQNDEAALECLARHCNREAVVAIPLALNMDWWRHPQIVEWVESWLEQAELPVAQVMVICNNNGNHYFPMWLDLVTRTVYYFDSLGHDRISYAQTIATPLLGLCHRTIWTTGQWRYKWVRGPRQTESECAVFTWSVLERAMEVTEEELFNNWEPMSRLKMFTKVMNVAIALGY